MKLIAPFILVLSLTACITHTALPTDKRPQTWTNPIINQSVSLSNLHQVSPTLYRSALPHTKDSNTLQMLGIDTIINLREQADDVGLANDFILTHIPIKTRAIDKYDLLKAMQAIEVAQKNGQKALVHCYHGSDRTGIVIAMYRVIFEHWTVEQARFEMKFGGYGYHPIWVNIDKLLSDETAEWIKAEMGQSH